MIHWIDFLLVTSVMCLFSALFLLSSLPLLLIHYFRKLVKPSVAYLFLFFPIFNFTL